MQDRTGRQKPQIAERPRLHRPPAQAKVAPGFEQGACIRPLTAPAGYTPGFFDPGRPTPKRGHHGQTGGATIALRQLRQKADPAASVTEWQELRDPIFWAHDPISDPKNSRNGKSRKNTRRSRSFTSAWPRMPS